jgi:hypothetical protein
MTAAAAPRRRNDTVVWAMAATVFWAAAAYLGVLLFNATPRSAAFDLDLLVDAGRAVAAGQSPYDPALLNGTAPAAVDLFYSYPPLVGQFLAPLSGVPLGLIAIGWTLAALALLVVAALRIAELLGTATSRGAVAAGIVAVAAMTLPFLVAALFGNLDVFFPAVYGFVLISALSSQRRDVIAGGAALALGAITKVYPAGLGLWFIVRAARAHAGAERRQLLMPLAVAAAVALGLVAFSVLVLGPTPWQEYGTVASTAARAEVVDGRNAAPSAQLALWLGSSSDVARLLHLPIVILAVATIALAGWRIADPVLSLAVASTATLFLLPISWIHYPAALLPFGIAAVVRSRALEPRARRAVRRWAALALVAAAGAIVWMPSLWLATAAALLGVRASASGIETREAAVPGALRPDPTRP